MHNKLSIKIVGVSLGALLAISYILCVAWDLILPQYAMHVVWAPLLPGFVWLTASNFILGLIESFLYGIYIALIFVPMYNYLLEKMS